MRRFIVHILCILSVIGLLAGCGHAHTYTLRLGGEKIGFDTMQVEIFSDDLMQRTHKDIGDDGVKELLALWERELHPVDGAAPMARAAVPQKGSLRFHLGEQDDKLFLYNEPAIDGKYYYVLYLDHTDEAVKLFAEKDMVAESEKILENQKASLS